MSAFKTLRDVSTDFENYSRQVCAEIFSARICKPFEDVLASKMLRDLNFYTSKSRLLEAKLIADKGKIKTEDTILDYDDAVSFKIIEQQVVKVVTQNHSVKNLLTTPDQHLRPEFVAKKERIIEVLVTYSQNESELRSLEDVLVERESKLLKVRREWDELVGKMRDTPKVATNKIQMDGPLYKRLKSISEKIEMMRWLIAKFVTSRYDTDYEWSADPHKRLRALAIARQKCSVRV